LSAHELGHNWNAPHCDADPACGIMCSSISGCNQNNSSFEPGTIAIIEAYRDSVTCLGLAAAPTWGVTALPADDVLAGDRFGTSVCVSGNLAIIGAGGDDGPIGIPPGTGVDTGSATIYRFDGTNWVREVKLDNPLPYARASDRFGT